MGNKRAACVADSAGKRRKTAGEERMGGKTTDLDEMLKAAGISDDTAPDDIDPATFRSGFVTLVGRPNAGKSTLLNAIMGEKLAITSDTPQTTRHRFRAVYDTDDMQMVVVDTPGLHKPEDALGAALDDSALKAIEGVDVVAMLVDASKPVGGGDRWVAKSVAAARTRKILVVSKTDTVSRERTEAQVLAAKDLAEWDAIVCLSAVSGKNVDAFIEEVARLLPHGPRWFPKGTGLDQPVEVVVAEFIREKILRSMRDEVPHACGVEVEQIETDKRTGFRRIWAVVYVERDSQKGIIIGRGGRAIKRVGSEARADLERFFDAKVHLDLSVKVRKNWRRDANQVKRFGYGEGL